MPRYFRRKTVLAKIEGSYGVDPTPTGAANAVLLRNVTITPHQADYVDRDVVHNYLGHDEQLIVGKTVGLSFEIEVAGSGTAGTAPAWGPLLRACGFSELALGVAHAGTAQAGSTSTTIKLAVAASASNEAYRGMQITTTGGTGNGQSRVISTYDGATKIATVSQAWTVTPDITTTYSIGAQVAYLPVSSGMESVTVHFNMDGKQHKLAGCRGTLDVRMNAKEIPVFAVNLMGLYVAPTDVPLAAVTLTAWQRPIAVNNSNTSGFVLHGYAATMNALSVTLGNNTVHRNLVGQEDIQLSDRAPTGKVGVEDVLLATKNYFTNVSAVTLDALDITHGTAAGNIVRLHTPKAQLTNPAFQDKDGIVGLDMDLRLVPNLGDDELVIQAA